jgi:hypothetical protein
MLVIHKAYDLYSHFAQWTVDDVHCGAQFDDLNIRIPLTSKIVKDIRIPAIGLDEAARPTHVTPLDVCWVQFLDPGNLFLRMVFCCSRR